MNIHGSPQYSKEILSARQPGRMGPSAKSMILVYPILFSHKTPQDLLLKCRKFYSTSVLKEIFSNNYLNIVNLSSKIRPILDKQGNKVDTASVISKAIGNYRSNYDYNYDYSGMYSQAVQQKINEKTFKIKQVLNSDPTTKKLLPHIEWITLQNLIDVPVIVGTAPLPIDTSILMYVLIAAISLRKRLNSLSDIDYIFKTLKSIDEKSWINLLSSLNITDQEFFKKEQEQDKRQLFKRQRPTGLTLQKIENYLTKYGEIVSRAISQKNEFMVLDYVKDKLSETHLFFKFVLDPKFLEKRYGIRTYSGQSIMASSLNTSGSLSQVLDDIYNNFIKLFSATADSTLHSLSNILYPIDGKIDYLEAKRKCIESSSGLFGKLEDSIDKSLHDVIRNALSEYSVDDLNEVTKKIKNLCNGLDNTNELFARFVNRLSDVSLESYNFGLDEYKRFIKTLESVVSKCQILNKEFLKTFRSLVRDNSFYTGVNMIRSIIIDSLNDFIYEYIKQYSDTDRVYPAFYHLLRSNGANITLTDIKTNIAPQFATYIAEYIIFMFMYSLQLGICSFIDVLDVKVETVKNDVTEWPNYILVLPVEIMTALYSAMMSRGWKNLVSSPNPASNVILPSENYIKGIIKNLNMKFKVPNLIVYDSSKNEVYYQFMYMSDVQKIKNTTIDTFIKLVES